MEAQRGSSYAPDCVVCEGRGDINIGANVCPMCSGSGKWGPGAACPCGCNLVALKLTKRGHVVGCKCRPCLGARNRRRGQRAQKNAHRALGGTGNTPKRKKPTKTALKKKADAIAGRICRARGYCEAAGKDDVRCGGVLQWAHIEGRRNLALRWKPWNCLCLCGGHHIHYSDQPMKWSAFIEKHFPENARLIREHRGSYFDGDYDALLSELKTAEAEL